MIEMAIDSIRVSLMNYQRVVMLKEKGNSSEESETRYLPIWIGPAEADAIAVKLQNVAITRPLTHDLLYSMITTLNASVAYVVVTELKDDTFFAKIYLDVDGQQVEVDCRPSDALALAVRVKPAIPIYVEEAVLGMAGITLDKETGKPTSTSKPGKSGGKNKLGEQELKRLSAFWDFINTLDLEDFDKRKS